ncbi:uncharacterized protein LOC124253982 [Haliotis rubra]|uniref:uncharacterized protein LOC124253982 n=1 Tax=Haliotis rubra TaxID=36100 RepID=UPI001EE56856|nr:uncharacterized protein LOC124253982 [Haliotis rubra]
MSKRCSIGCEIWTHDDYKGRPAARFAKELSHSNIAPLPSDVKELHVPFSASKRDAEDIYRKRREHLKYVCNVENIKSQTRENWADQLWHFKPLNILYCPLENHDTVTWKKTFEIWMRSQSNFDVIGKEDTFEQDTLYVYNKLKSPDMASDFEDFQLEYDFSIIEGYVETAFTRKNNITCISTYSMYLRLWRQLQIWGYISNNITFPYTKAESLSLEYSQLLDATLTAYQKSVPMSRSNRFDAIGQAYFDLNLGDLGAADLDFDVIGKEDTFEQDTLYVYNKLKSPDMASDFEDFQLEYDFSIIEGYVETAFTRKNNITCISTYSMYLRLWRQLQIWGYISNNITFPYTKAESLSLEYSQLLDAALTAYQKSVPMSRSNRFDAIAQAYHVLSLSELNVLRALYADDFYLFDYNDRPGLVYFKQAPQSGFSYFDVIVKQE